MPPDALSGATSFFPLDRGSWRGGGGSPWETERGHPPDADQEGCGSEVCPDVECHQSSKLQLLEETAGCRIIESDLEVSCQLDPDAIEGVLRSSTRSGWSWSGESWQSRRQ